MFFVLKFISRIKALDAKQRYTLALFFVLFFAITTFMPNYHRPSNLFWDENYYLTAVQKYTDRMVFFESHPPLGKLIMALGENIFARNTHLDLQAFTETEKITSIPKGYSFFGVRFFPVLFAVFGAVLFFMILYRLIGKSFFAFIFSSYYIFDNAWVLHSRGAMLDSIQFFFILAAILLFIHLVEKKSFIRVRDYFALACLCSLAIMVKVNAIFMLILFPILFIYEYRQQIRERWLKQDKKFWWSLGKKSAIAALGLVLIGFTVFMIHFSLGKQIPGGHRQAISPEYRAIIDKGGTSNPLNFPIMLRDHIVYMHKYHSTVPKFRKYDEKSFGSRPITWALGEKSIRYRWAKNDGKVRYLYLQGNPVVWMSGLIGLALAFALLTGRALFKLTITNSRLFWYIALFFGLYAVYMASVMRVDRVLYLYHYFIPLFFSLFMAALIFTYFFQKKIEEGDRILVTACGIYFAEIVATFIFFMPLTYYLPLTTKEFLQRAWLDIWELKYVQ
jgi:dolichyl-phosphate-mannose--protein O-mannosyl transferase